MNGVMPQDLKIGDRFHGHNAGVLWQVAELPSKISETQWHVRATNVCCPLHSNKGWTILFADELVTLKN